MLGPSLRKDSSVLFNPLKPSLYPLFATSVCLSVIGTQRKVRGKSTMIIPGGDPGEVSRQKLQIGVRTILSTSGQSSS